MTINKNDNFLELNSVVLITRSIKQWALGREKKHSSIDLACNYCIDKNDVTHANEDL